jgi:hypothetical protein
LRWGKRANQHAIKDARKGGKKKQTKMEFDFLIQILEVVL